MSIGAGITTDTLRVAALQMSSGADVAANLKQAEKYCCQAAQDGAQLVVLPENFAFLTGRDADKLKLDRSVSEELPEFARELARRLNIYLVAGAVPVYSDASTLPVSSSMLCSPAGELLGSYSKIHLFDVNVPGSDEHYRESSCTRGGDVVETVNAAGTCIGLSVCYDLRFPELYREQVRQGAEILTVPAAFTERTGRAHWKLLLQARAVENLSFVIGAGQTGEHPGGRRTWGHSMIVGPWGDILAAIGREPGYAIADLDLGELRNQRRGFPVLDHRRL